MQPSPKTFDEPMTPDWAETNPTYWLEIRQTRRNYLFFALLFGGILAGAYLFLIVFDPADLWWDDFPLLMFPITVYVLGALAVPIYVGLKLATQLVREDLSLQTPLRSRTILWGKLQVAMTLSLCVFLPSLPGAVVLAFMEKPNFLLIVTAGPVLAICIAMIELGFMAGAKTSLMWGGMGFLSFVFGIGNLPALISLGGGFASLFAPSIWLDTWEAAYALSFGITVLFISSLFMFSIGLAVLQRNRNLVHIQFAIAVMAVLLVPVPLLLTILVDPNSILGILLLAAAYFGPPLLELRYVRRYYEKRRMLSK